MVIQYIKFNNIQVMLKRFIAGCGPTERQASLGNQAFSPPHGAVHFGRIIDLAGFSKTPSSRRKFSLPPRIARWLRDSFGEAVYIKSLEPVLPGLPSA